MSTFGIEITVDFCDFGSADALGQPAARAGTEFSFATPVSDQEWKSFAPNSRDSWEFSNASSPYVIEKVSRVPGLARLDVSAYFLAEDLGQAALPPRPPSVVGAKSALVRNPHLGQRVFDEEVLAVLTKFGSLGPTGKQEGETGLPAETPRAIPSSQEPVDLEHPTNPDLNRHRSLLLLTAAWGLTLSFLTRSLRIHQEKQGTSI